MCMKNVNTDAILFENISGDVERNGIIDLLGVNKAIPSVYAEKIDDTLLRIPALRVFFSLCAIEKKHTINDSSQSPDEDNVFHMDREYRVRLRITETSSGDFFDLDTIDVDPRNKSIGLCNNIFTMRGAYQYTNVLVRKPGTGKDLCVLKVLIQRSNDKDNWIVQSMHPIRLVVNDN